MAAGRWVKTIGRKRGEGHYLGTGWRKSESGEAFQAVVKAGYWFGSCLEDANSFALVGCTVAPGFDFADFELGNRTELLEDYPPHRELILRLTRD